MKLTDSPKNLISAVEKILEGTPQEKKSDFSSRYLRLKPLTENQRQQRTPSEEERKNAEARKKYQDQLKKDAERHPLKGKPARTPEEKALLKAYVDQMNREREERERQLPPHPREGTFGFPTPTKQQPQEKIRQDAKDQQAASKARKEWVKAQLTPSPEEVEKATLEIKKQLSLLNPPVDSATQPQPVAKEPQEPEQQKKSRRRFKDFISTPSTEMNTGSE